MSLSHSLRYQIQKLVAHELICDLLTVEAIGCTIETPPPPDVDSILWSALKDVISRRGSRKIPWVTGIKGSWSFHDRLEEIYLDEYSREQVRIYLHSVLN